MPQIDPLHFIVTKRINLVVASLEVGFSYFALKALSKLIGIAW